MVRFDAVGIMLLDPSYVRYSVGDSVPLSGVQAGAAFAANHQCYGSRRPVTALANRGVSVGRFKVCRLMRQAGSKPVWKRKFVHTTDSKLI
jgi:hypothetical protein